MKIVDKSETQKITNKQRPNGAKGTEAIVKGWELNDFKLGFLQLRCKASLIFKSN